MKGIEKIVSAIESATTVKPFVKGGNTVRPIEYSYYRVGFKPDRFRLEIDINTNDLLKAQELSDKIIERICTFHDLPSIEGIYIVQNGGGLLSKNGTITQVLYFDVTEY